MDRVVATARARHAKKADIGQAANPDRHPEGVPNGWHKQRHSDGYSAPTSLDSLSLAFVIRAYYGDKGALRQLLKQLDKFAHPRIERVIVLDEESTKDHALGESLRTEFNVTVFYEAIPHGGLPVTHNFGHKYARVGYTRQAWANFHLDKYSNADLIGNLDSDASVFTAITPDTILDPQGRILIRALECTDRYFGDNGLLNFPKYSDAQFEYMWSDVMPAWMWRETYGNARKYISENYHTKESG